ncbi:MULTISPECIES: hypothetical protein [unclassified Rhodococcus (in: high G+C Gram-positive bacteria)]|uniref:DUF7373 family lipoprotein n=1 Tax=unclassified Rhodococcus (in: high G+C Gram-positive bacteria) TaxID=192944 RepID=UPI0016398525|nr:MULTISPECIES: hypothetical protein [unclassified Rhodococcus (in: high G+C Gram-positive bacteria)]MBC2637835.1 hypothetical protein [Rhodococcus sp. 3A]MBC2897418.1 hypothetical protein [Rhodococcus sp. 4CII]
MLDAFVDDLTAPGGAAAPVPAGLPGAKCLAKDTTSGEENYCYVVNGRYMGEAGGLDKKDVDQQISAQYLILEHADQNAESPPLASRRRRGFGECQPARHKLPRRPRG